MTWEYISGFFDADGSICLTSTVKNQPKTIQISFHNNDLNLLKQIQVFIYNNLNIKGNIKTKQPKSSLHNIAYDLKYTNRSALSICYNLNPTHLKKKHKINTIKKYYLNVTPRNGKYSHKLLSKKIALERLFYWSLVS